VQGCYTRPMSEERKHKGWHSRGYLPHLDAAELIQAITFRLADALPKNVIEGWKRELEREMQDGDPRSEQMLRERIARFEDAGHGCCVLGEPRKRNETADGRRFTQIIKELY